MSISPTSTSRAHYGKPRMIQDVPIAWVIGFDPSLRSSGLALWNMGDRKGEHVFATAVKVPDIPNASLREDAYRISRMVKTTMAHIDSMVAGQRSLLMIEGPVPHMRHSAKQHERAGVFWGVASACLRFADVARVPPTNVKKYWTGNGAADKNRMMEATRQRWPDRMLGSDDEADALALADMGRHALTGQGSVFHPVDFTQLRKVEWPRGFTPKEWTHGNNDHL